MTHVPPSRYLLFLALAGLGCAVDLWTKSYVFAWLGMPPNGGTYWVWDKVFGFTTNLNEGALFGMGQGRVGLFAIFSVVAAVGIFWWLFFAGAAADLLLTVALGCVMAGIFGNLYDRLGMPGLKWTWPPGRVDEPVYAVRDWLNFQIPGVFEWPIFNIADSFLVCGAAMLIWHTITSKPQQIPGTPISNSGKPASVSPPSPASLPKD